MNAELEKEIFGNSEDEDDLDLDIEEMILSDDENIIKDQIPIRTELPEFQKKKDLSTDLKKKIRQKKVVVERIDEDMDPEERKLMEARKDVDDALDRIKPKKIKKDLVEETVIDEMLIIMLGKMKDAAETDHELNILKQAAIAKIKLLDTVEEQITKAHLWEQMLDNDILEGIKTWIEPMRGDGSLPSLEIQRVMMKALTNMPIRTEHLRQSQIGKVIMFYSKCEIIVPEISKIVKYLLDKWIRPILNLSDNYKDRTFKEVDFHSLTRSFAPAVSKFNDPDKLVSSSIQNRARIPQPVAPDYDMIPRSNVVVSSEKKITERERKLKNKMVMMKRRSKI